MTLKKNDQNIQAMAQIIATSVMPLKIILFGSHTTGNATKNSDIDLLVIEEGQFNAARSRRKESGKIWRSLIDFNVPKDILVFSLDEVQKFQNNPLHIVSQAIQTGQVIYERK